MKVLYITSTWFVDGDFPLIRRLIKQGVEVHLCIKVYASSLTSTILNFDKAYPHLGIFDSSIYNDEIDKFKEYLGINKIHIINYTKSQNSLCNLSLLKQEYNLIKNIKPDVIHHIGWPSLYEIPLTYSYGKKFLVTIHDATPHVVNIKTKIFRALRLATNKPIERYILLNTIQIAEFKRYYHINENKICISRLGNFDVINVFGDESVQENQNILFFGRISPYKGVEYLLAAFENIQLKHPNVKLIVAGGGDYYFDISKYQNNQNIEFINEYISMDRLATLVRQSQFIVCPYISATQSGVIASAFALGKPVIATRVGGIPEMIEDGETGLLINPKSTSELEASMLMLIENKEKLNMMRGNIVKKSMSGRNSWDSIAKDYLLIYKHFVR